jgi:hypothetical protein
VGVDLSDSHNDDHITSQPVYPDTEHVVALQLVRLTGRAGDRSPAGEKRHIPGIATVQT